MSGVPVTIRASALPAWRALQQALRGVVPPCARRAEWISEDAEERAYAAGHCQGCPALAACRAFAISNQEPAGVWAGIDMGDRAAVRSLRKELSA